MHDAIKFIKDAVQRGPASVGCSDCYISDGKTLRASNDILHAGIDWPSGVEFVLPAAAVDAFLSRCFEVRKIDVEENAVVLHSDRRHRSTVSRRFEEPRPPPVLPDEWSPVPEGLLEALKVAIRFTDETQTTGGRAWLSGVRLWGDRVTASSGKMVIDITLPGLGIERPTLLGKSVVEFLLSQDTPDEYGVDRSSVSFRWDDGRWVRCQTINAEMPEEIVRNIFNEKVGADAPVPITAEWREAHADALALGDSSVALSITGFRAIKENIVSEIALNVDVPSDHMSWWATKDIGTVIEVASAWNPLAYPQPALFVGDGFRGAIVGVQR